MQTVFPREKPQQRAWDVRRTIPANPETARGRKGARPERNAHVSIRLSEARKDLIEESRLHSTYRDSSVFLRAVSTGWDPRAPITAKAGIASCWAGTYLGRKAGRKEWNELERLFRSLLGVRSLEGSLRLAEKHVLAALSAKTAPDRLALGLIGRRGAGREIRQQLIREGGRSCTKTYKISERRLATTDRAVSQEGYSSRSGYIRSVALGQDRSCETLAMGAVVLFWLRSHAGETVDRAEWLQLDGLMREHTGTYLFSDKFLSGESSPSKDYSRDSNGESPSDSPSSENFPTGQSLWRVGAHLLASSADAISAETGLSIS